MIVVSAQPLVHSSATTTRASASAASPAATANAATRRTHAGACATAPLSSSRPRLVSAATASSAAAPSTTTTTTTTPTTFELACPICHVTPFRLPSTEPYTSDCPCPRCGRTFLVSRGAGSASAFVDLTLQSGAPPAVFEQKSWVGTELFRTEAVSSIYERGWRQGFARAGFPGPQREFDLAMRYFEPVLMRNDGGEGGGEGGASNRRGPVLIDASCGTGLFTRLFARSGAFSGVVALDYSETMLRETRRLLGASR